MGYNLDFSAWKDMRNAQVQSILNQANIAANLTANKYDTINKTISGLAKNGLWAYDAAKKQANKDAAMAAYSSMGNNGMQDSPLWKALNESGNLTGDLNTDYERMRILGGLLGY